MQTLTTNFSFSRFLYLRVWSIKKLYDPPLWPCYFVLPFSLFVTSFRHPSHIRTRPSRSPSKNSLTQRQTAPAARITSCIVDIDRSRFYINQGLSSTISTHLIINLTSNTRPYHLKSCQTYPAPLELAKGLSSEPSALDQVSTAVHPHHKITTRTP